MNVHNLPPQPTSFIGREADVAEVLRLVANSDCRLLTLVGPGGIGKTRLAIQTTNTLRQKFAYEVYFVPLQTARSMEALISAVADALRIPLSGQETPRLQLLNYLRHKTLLLVLDNFEQLLGSESVFYLTDILETAPSIKLLTTSREVLNLQEEWLYRVQSLSYPDDTDDTFDITEYSAVQLFAERARRVRQDFSLAAEQASVTRICRLVEGVPLAIELAASWAKTMPCALIADEIERNLNFLTTSLRNVPEQHRSVQAVFDHSWSLLSREEQAVFKRLSIFRGGFRRDAAEQVTGASLHILSTLADKSLLRWERDGRYQIHELLRQYAEAQLQAAPEEPAEIHDLHCAYYSNFLASRRAGILAGRQREVVVELRADLDNLRAAWQWAVDRAKVPEIHKSVATLDLFFQMQSRYLEGANAFEKAVQSLDRVEPSELRDKTLGEILGCQGWCRIRVGQFQRAKALFEQSQVIFQTLNIQHPPGAGTDPLVGLGTLANIQGNYVVAVQLGEAARQQNEASGDRQNLVVAYYVLANAALAQGQYQAAQHHAQQAYTIAQAINDRWMAAYLVSDLGRVAQALGDYDQARQYYQTAYDLRYEFDDPEGMAVALNHLGEIARLQNDYQMAENLHRQSLAIYRDISDKGGLAAALNGLGQIACAQDDYQAAQHHLQEALQITTQIQFMPLTLAILASVGKLLLRTHRLALGVEVLTFIQHHPACDHETEVRAQQLLTDCTATIAPDDFAAAIQRGQNSNLETIITAVQAQLAAPFEAEGPRSKGAEDKMFSPAPLLPHPPVLVEPLTERELEVLQLIAEGLTNREIAERLSVVIGTVKAHNNSIYGKLGVNSRVQALKKAQSLNLL